MPQIMDMLSENPDEDRVSLQSNGKKATDGAAKKNLNMMKKFRNSMKKATEQSPLSHKSKNYKVKFNEGTTGNEIGSASSHPPPSPSLSASSPATSPQKKMLGFFQKKEDPSPQKDKQLTRSNTDPNLSRFSESLVKKGESIRRSLRFPRKTDDSDKKVGETPPITDANSLAEMTEEEEDGVMDVFEEIDELYTLPEIPHTPLSVMQINKLIVNEVLEEAHMNLLALRLEFQRDQEQFVKDCPVELCTKEKDLNLLYRDLMNKISSIVRDSNSFPARNKGLLVLVARIIQEEEKRAKEPGGLSDSWMTAWKEAVCQGVEAKVKSVHLEQKDQNASWLAVHLGLLGKVIVEDLETVKRDLRWSYPPSFKVFSTYLKSYHRVVGLHLKKLEQQTTELKDLYQLLDWILNKYKSEMVMGSLPLQPDMTDESTDLLLEEDFLKHLKEKYCSRIKEDMRTTLGRVIELENEFIWRVKKQPEKEDNFLKSEFPMDIWTNVKGNIQNSRRLHAELEQRVISSLLEELKNFPERFETEFQNHCSALKPQQLWTEYQITYINSFTALQQHMEGYHDSCPDEVEGFRKEVKGLIERLLQGLEKQFKEDVESYLRRMMTRKWLTSDDDFNHLHKRIELLSKHCDLMSPPHVQEFVSRLHYHVVREYIGQLMKNNYTCKNQKHEKAAIKIRQQWDKLTYLFEEMKSTNKWLHPVGDDLGNIIGQKNNSDIKNHLQPLLEHYPDFNKKHLVAVLHFRGLTNGRDHQLILRRLTALKEETDSSSSVRSQVLFEDMQVTSNTDCLHILPFSCLCSS
ncbi:exocyst complex component 3-like protein 4 [Leuresthes tenuis]|uniref:exocyst complex component 3-like protein 4 n=1 Tax=Leuresthes tenuis TaxID=355514 RepID=UPI003B508C12